MHLSSDYLLRSYSSAYGLFCETFDQAPSQRSTILTSTTITPVCAPSQRVLKEWLMFLNIIEESSIWTLRMRTCEILSRSKVRWHSPSHSSRDLACSNGRCQYVWFCEDVKGARPSLAYWPTRIWRSSPGHPAEYHACILPEHLTASLRFTINWYTPMQ